MGLRTSKVSLVSKSDFDFDPDTMAHFCTELSDERKENLNKFKRMFICSYEMDIVILELKDTHLLIKDSTDDRVIYYENIESWHGDKNKDFHGIRLTDGEVLEFRQLSVEFVKSIMHICQTIADHSTSFWRSAPQQ